MKDKTYFILLKNITSKLVVLSITLSKCEILTPLIECIEFTLKKYEVV